jgi:hypothetical protein
VSVTDQVSGIYLAPLPADTGAAAGRPRPPRPPVPAPGRRPPTALLPGRSP